MEHLTPKQRRFVNEYCVDENATQAAIRAGYSEDTAGQIGCENLKKPNIQKAMEERKKDLAIVAGITPEWIVAQWAKIAGADPSELVAVKRECCRHCHGVAHRYQWTEAEYMEAVNAAADAGKTPPDGLGGFGFNPNAEPHPMCPECGGNGHSRVHIADTRKVNSPLYDGAEQTRSGIKIKLRSRDDAANNLARYLGMIVDKKELSGPNGGPIPLANLRAEDLTDEQLAALIANGPADQD